MRTKVQECGRALLLTAVGIAIGGCSKSVAHQARAPGGHAVTIYQSHGLSKSTFTFVYEKATKPPRELIRLIDDVSAGLFIVAWSQNPEQVVVKACDMRRPLIRGVRLAMSWNK